MISWIRGEKTSSRGRKWSFPALKLDFPLSRGVSGAKTPSQENHLWRRWGTLLAQELRTVRRPKSPHFGVGTPQRRKSSSDALVRHDSGDSGSLTSEITRYFASEGRIEQLSRLLAP